jgi:GNAT superfamily N-acetyltransferase
MKKILILLICTLSINFTSFAHSINFSLGQDNIVVIKNSEEISQSFEVFSELYPNYLKNKKIFFDMVESQNKEGFHLIGIVEDNKIVACINFQITTLIPIGKVMYVSDLITKEKYRKKGYGTALLNYAVKFGKDNGCKQIQLNCEYNNYKSHKFYLNYGFILNSLQLAARL